jgi:hypothetical protein
MKRRGAARLTKKNNGASVPTTSDIRIIGIRMPWPSPK